MAFDINSLFANTKGLQDEASQVGRSVNAITPQIQSLIPEIGNISQGISQVPVGDLGGAAGIDQGIFNQLLQLARQQPNLQRGSSIFGGLTNPTVGTGPNGAFLDPTQTGYQTQVAQQGARGDTAGTSSSNALSAANMLPQAASSFANITNEQGALSNQQGNLQNQAGNLATQPFALFNQQGGLFNQLGSQNNQIGALQNAIRALNNQAASGATASGGLFQNLLGL
jgi:hypothetical protein